MLGLQTSHRRGRRMVKSQIYLAAFIGLRCTSALATIEAGEAQALCKRQVEMTGKEIAACEAQVLDASRTYGCSPSSVETEPPLSMLFEGFAREKREAMVRRRQQQEASAAAKVRAALPSPRIGMSSQQV